MYNRALYDKIISKLDIRGPGECWRYLGTIAPDTGYGKVYITSTRQMNAHRALMIAKYGPLGRWDFVCHHCDNRWCVNPSHLYIGNNQMNARDMAARKRHHLNRRTHCIHGHEFTPQNTYHYVDRDGWKHRKCLACHERRQEQYAQARRERTLLPTGDRHG